MKTQLVSEVRPKLFSVLLKFVQFWQLASENDLDTANYLKAGAVA